jgi:hypothetical protein
VIAALPVPWRLVKKRDHYFVQIEDQPMVCVANNSSKRNDWQVRRTLEELRRAVDG